MGGGGEEELSSCQTLSGTSAARSFCAHGGVTSLPVVIQDEGVISPQLFPARRRSEEGLLLLLRSKLLSASAVCPDASARVSLAPTLTGPANLGIGPGPSGGRAAPAAKHLQSHPTLRLASLVLRFMC